MQGTACPGARPCAVNPSNKAKRLIRETLFAVLQKTRVFQGDDLILKNRTRQQTTLFAGTRLASTTIQPHHGRASGSRSGLMQAQRGKYVARV